VQTTAERAEDFYLEDNPRRRFLEVIEDRHFGTDDSEVSLAELRRRALAAARTLSPGNETNLTPATPGGSNWIELGPTGIPKGQTYGGARVIVTGRVTEIVQHPTDPLTLYVATARGGIWRSTDGGITWSPQSDHEESLAIGALAIAPSNPQTLYAGTGEGDIYYYRVNFPLSSANASYEGVGILKSTDGGDTWTLQGSAEFTGRCFYKMAVHPSNDNIAFAASNLGLHRTTNGGANWVQLSNGLPAISSTIIAGCDIVIHPTNPDIVYCAFWANGIYKTTNATAANPSWTKLGGGLPTTNLSRIALAIAPTAPNNIYALIADASDGFGGFYISDNEGNSWNSIAAASGVVEMYGAFTLNVFVDISTPDIVYLSGVELYKAVRTMGTWSVTNIGGAIHPDNHAFASHPTDHLIIYAGNDGGIYKSTNGGAIWDDRINEGINITQFEFIGQHPTSDAMVIGGTQDNGTEMFHNHPAFYHSADGDGGAAGIDASDPRNVIHTYYSASPERSTHGGTFGSYSPIWNGLVGNVLFYPPFSYDETNAQNLAFGTDRINLDASQGTGGWPMKVTLPGITGRVSAIHYPNSNLIYAGTSAGRVYRLTKSGASWTATAIHAAPLPSRWIWDISTLPGDTDTLVVVMAGFGTPHAWRGTMGAGGTFSWTDISGTIPNALPDVPINSLAIDPLNSTHYYAGTDIGVFRTTDAGVNWQLYSDGLPNTAVYDLRLHTATRLLRAATHGRGLWERKLDVASSLDVDLYMRDHLMSTSRILPIPSPVMAAFEDPLQHVSVGDNLWWWQCVDAKVDAPAPGTHDYQLPVSEVDYFAFETKLEHRNAQRGVLNRVYVQVHNRGIQAANNVTVKILYADASPGLPDLPSDFWAAFPGDGTTTVWKPIGLAKVIPSLSPKRPEVLEWDWVPPLSAASHSCLLIVVDCQDDPISADNKVFDMGTLVVNEKRVALKNLHVIDALPAPLWSDLRIYGKARGRDVLRLSGLPSGWSVGLLFPEQIAGQLQLEGFDRMALTQSDVEALEQFLHRRVQESELEHFYALARPREGAVIRNIPAVGEGFPVLFLYRVQRPARPGSFTIVQMEEERVIGGNTFILRLTRN
jgi:photosystem II stability/assembly factor-like uncharacterized protein